MLLKADPQILVGKTDRMEGRNRHFSSNHWKHLYLALNNGYNNYTEDQQGFRNHEQHQKLSSFNDICRTLHPTTEYAFF